MLPAFEPSQILINLPKSNHCITRRKDIKNANKIDSLSPFLNGKLSRFDYQSICQFVLGDEQLEKQIELLTTLKNRGLDLNVVAIQILNDNQFDVNWGVTK